ncbi:MAG: HlyD family efflux transporter periplasmic adaptor subunit [Gammaproteobacteria bacterium]
MDDDLVGLIEPRLMPAERIGLTNQLATARSEFSASTASVAVARAAYERARILNADNKNVSDRVVEDATARLQAEEARLKSATDTVRLLESSLQSSGPTGNKPLTVERGGDVVEIMAQPGESIEPGSPILRIARLDRLLARVDVPPGQHVPASATTARIYAVGYENTSIAAERVAVAAAVDPKSQGESFLFRLTGTLFGLRPGLAATARMNVPGPRKAGVVVPRSAIVRVMGRSFAYVQTGTDQFARKEVPRDNPVEDGYLATANFAAGDRVVTQGAQILLSEEFKAQTAAEQE